MTNAWASAASNSAIRILKRDPLAQTPSVAQQHGAPSSAPAQTGARPKKTMAEVLADRFQGNPSAVKASLAPVAQGPRVLKVPRNLSSADGRTEAQAQSAVKKEPQDIKKEPAEAEAPAERPELTEEEREVVRQLRRERRRKEKDRRRKEREEQKRAMLYMPKTSKLKFISPQQLQAAAATDSGKKPQTVNLTGKFSLFSKSIMFFSAGLQNGPRTRRSKSGKVRT